MPGKDIFLSVGGIANAQQESFVSALEDRLRAEGLTPHTVGRNAFSADAPLRAIESLMDKCVGTVVVALERSYFPKGLEKRGGEQEKELVETRLTTPWNHIEAALSYGRGMPLLVIVEKGIKSEGLLEPGNDWYVQTVPLQLPSLSTKEFNGVLASWKEKLGDTPRSRYGRDDSQTLKAEDMTVGQIVGALKPAQLWSLLASLAAVVGGAFALGAQLIH